MTTIPSFICIKLSYSWIYTIFMYSLLINLCSSQKQCATVSFPPILPITSQQTFNLDLSEYIQGPNITYKLINTQNPQISLTPKYEIKQTSYNKLEKIISSSLSNKTFVLLGQQILDANKKFYLYIGNINQINSISLVEIPFNMGQCQSVRINKNEIVIVIGRFLQQKDNQAEYFFTTGMYDIKQKKWDIIKSIPYSIESKKKAEFIDQNLVAISVFNQSNSYIQLIDLKYKQTIGVYDRTFFSKSKFNISDVTVFQNKLYVLQYEYGVYQLYYNNFDSLIISQTYNYYHYQAISANTNFIVLAKPGTLVQFRNSISIKYENFPVKNVLSIKSSISFIYAYLEGSQIFIYERGIIAPYMIIERNNYQSVFGQIISRNLVLEISSPFKVKEQKSISVIIDKIVISAPILQILPLQQAQVGKNINIQINGYSKINEKTEVCKFQFIIEIVKNQSYLIYQNQDRNIQKFYLNRPGRTTLNLRQFGIGPGLTYEVQDKHSDLNYSAQIYKLNAIENAYIPNINTTTFTNVYTSKNCDSSLCPLVINTNSQKVIRYLKCRIFSNFYQKNGLQCEEGYRQYKFNQYSHFVIKKVQMGAEFTFYEISVTENNRNQFMIRKFYDGQPGFNFSVLATYTIAGDNLYGQNNITQIQYLPNQHIMIILLRYRKQIRIYQTSDPSPQISIKLVNVINRETFDQVIDYFSPQGFKLDSLNNLWVPNFDRIYVIRFLGVQNNKNVEILSIINIAGTISEFQDYGLQIVERKVSQVSSLKNNVIIGYLVIYSAPNLLQFCAYGINYGCLYGFRQLPLYGNQIPTQMFKDDKVKNRISQSLSQYHLSILMNSKGSNNYKILVYNLDQFSTPLSLYFETNQIPSSQVPFPIYLNQNTKNPIVLNILPQKQIVRAIFECYSIFTNPSITIFIPLSLSVLKNDIVTLDIYNKNSIIRKNFEIQISNYPQNLTKGSLFPNKALMREAQQIYIEIDTIGWVSGNVIFNQYSCKICNEPSLDSWVQVRNKIWKRATVNISEATQFYPLNQNSPQMKEIALIQNNLVFIFDLQTQNISASFSISLNFNDQIIQMKINQNRSFVVSLIKTQQGQYCINIFSTSSFKGFILSQTYLQTSIHFINSFYSCGDLIALTDYDGVYLYLIDHLGEIKQINFIGEIEAGGIICWGELKQDINNTYLLIVTLCDTGISLFRIQVDGQDVRVGSKQTIDFSAVLRKQNIRLPNDASFRRTLTFEEQHSLMMFAFINQFNSIYFKLQRKTGLEVDSVQIYSMIHRYGDFTLTEDISLEPVNKRYLQVLYHGIINNSPVYISAIYDLKDLQRSESDGQNFLHCYIMQTFTTQFPQQSKYVSPQTFVVLSSDLTSQKNKNLQIFNTSNAFRAVVHNYEQVYTQSIFIFPYTPTSSLIIELQLHGIDIIDHTWEIFFIILAFLISLLLVGFGCRGIIKQYIRKRKLVPLLVDYPEYEEDMNEQIQGQIHNKTQTKSVQDQLSEQLSDDENYEQQKRSSQLGGINYSVRQSTEQ